MSEEKPILVKDEEKYKKEKWIKLAVFNIFLNRRLIRLMMVFSFAQNMIITLGLMRDLNVAFFLFLPNLFLIMVLMRLVSEKKKRGEW